jgi:hypothetical protein
MVIGYDLQNAVNLHKNQTAIRINIQQIQGRMDTLETKIKTQQVEIDDLQTLMKKLLTLYLTPLSRPRIEKNKVDF